VLHGSRDPPEPTTQLLIQSPRLRGRAAWAGLRGRALSLAHLAAALQSADPWLGAEFAAITGPG
jgi:hypothetical protein